MDSWAQQLSKKKLFLCLFFLRKIRAYKRDRNTFQIILVGKTYRFDALRIFVSQHFQNQKNNKSYSILNF